MARRILNRKDLRADYEAAERRKTDDEEVDEEEGQQEEEDEEEVDEEAGEAGEAAEEEQEEEPPKKKKPAAEPKPKRSRAAKITRLKVVWGVFNNSNQRVAVYPYPKRKEADEHAARLTADKKSTHFVQPVKEPMEEKKEA